jgi:hypothetical protein
MRRFRIVHALSQRLWIIPSLGLLSGILLSLVTVAIDRRNENQLLSQSIVGNAADAQSILTTIATAVVTLTSLVLTVTLVAVQLAMGQFSPRIVRALLDDRGDQLVIAVCGATFTFTVFSLSSPAPAARRWWPTRCLRWACQATAGSGAGTGSATPGCAPTTSVFTPGDSSSLKWATFVEAPKKPRTRAGTSPMFRALWGAIAGTSAS